MFGIPFRKVILTLLATWTVIFVFIQLFSAPPLPEDNGQPPEPPKVSPTLINTINDEPFPKKLSFILLNWNRTECVKTVVKHAQIYHSFVSEIVIGNNNPQVNLLSEDFESSNIPLRVVNFPQNRYFYARYELCLMSKGLYCYMQDDDWDNKYLRSLYANFLRYPHLLHTTTNAYVHFLSWSWTFFEPDINLHTGFSWLGTGAIASKDSVERFIYSQSNLIAREHLIYADMYFSTWFNQVPYQLQNDLFELDSTQSGFSNQEGGILRNKLHMTKGVQMLYKQLTLKSNLLPVEEQHPFVEEQFTKSPCYADDCLFMTSVHSFPSPRNLIYDPQTDIEEAEVRHRKIVNPKTFVEFPYNYAVDFSLDTSWQALFDIQVGDFFGLDVLEPLEKEIIYLKVGHQYQGELSLEVSLDGTSWTSDGCTWDSEYKTIEMAYFYRYSLISDCTCKFRFIRFKAGGHYESPFQVFDIGFVDKLNVWEKENDNALRSDACSIAVPNVKPKEIIPKPRPSSALLREIGNGEIPVTLVVLNWKRTHNFPYIFDLLGQYPFVNEYIIWNNNKDKVLDINMIFPKNPPPPHVSVRIINSPQNLHDYAKYISCSMATNEYCYFQDDDWLNIYFRSQYTSFLRHPHLFHSMTIPIIYLEHRRWNIFDSSVGLHAGFSWLGVGSFTSKARVQRFLNQCSLFNLNQDELLQADLFFSYFNNDYPVELTTVASQLDQSGAWSTSVDQWSIVYRRLLLSSGKVYNYLKSGNNGTVIPNTKPVPAYKDRDIRSPCHTDECLFITNSYPFPYPQQVPFDPDRTIKEQEAAYNSLDWPSNWFWMFNSYDRAVDEDVYTPWTSYSVSKRGDYFGLDLLTYKLHQKFTVVLDHDIANYQIKVSSDAGSWTNVEYTIESSYLIGGPLELYILTLSYQKPFRLISFTLKKGKFVEGSQIMSLYELSEGSPFKIKSLSSNKVVNPSFEEWADNWRLEYPDGVNIDRLQDEYGKVALTGARSLAFSSAVGGVKYAASQEIILDQTEPREVVVSVFSKAEEVVNMDYPGPGYSVTIHLSFASGSTEWAAATYVFNPGTHGWQSRVFRVNPDTPLRAITVQMLFQNHMGTVQFDDVTVQEIL